MSSQIKPKDTVNYSHGSTASSSLIHKVVTQLLMESNTDQLVHAMRDGTLWIDIKVLSNSNLSPSPADFKILGPTRYKSTFDMSRGLWLLADFEGMSFDFLLEDEVEGIDDRVAFSNFSIDRLILNREHAVSELLHWAEKDIEKSLQYLNRFKDGDQICDYWTSGAPMGPRTWLVEIDVVE